MLRVGQCEACESWLLARNLVAARVVRPTIADRQRQSEMSAGVPGLEDPPLVAYFCAECEALMRHGPCPDGPAILCPGDPGFATATAPAARTAEP